MLRNLRAFQRRNVAVSFSHVNRFNSHLVKVSSSKTLFATNFPSRIFCLSWARSTYKFASRTNRRLLETFEYMQRKDRERPKREQLVSSFTLVRKIHREVDVDQLFELYEVLIQENAVTDSPGDSVAAISAQVALLSRFAALAEKQRKMSDFHRVNTATENLINTIKEGSSHFEISHLASAVWTFATRGITDESHLIHFEREIRSRDSSVFTNGNIAMIVWAYAKAGFHAPILYKKMRDEILARDLSSFKVKEICDILWSYARTKQTSAKLFAALKMEILRRDLKEFDEKSLINILWSYSEFGVNLKALFRTIKYEILQRGLPCFTHRQLAQIVNCYALQNTSSPTTLRVAPDLYKEVSSELLQRGELTFDPLGLVMVADGFAKTKNYIREIFKAVGDRIMNDDLSVYEPIQVVRLFWAFTDAGLLTEALHHKLSNQILLYNFPKLKDATLEELVKALEKNHFKAPELVAVTEAELVRRSEAKF